MLTVSDDERDVLQAMRAGADGYLLKDLEPRPVLQAQTGGPWQRRSGEPDRPC